MSEDTRDYETFPATPEGNFLYERFHRKATWGLYKGTVDRLKDVEAQNADLRARLERAEALCQLPSTNGMVTACAACGARGIPGRGLRPDHAAECPFAGLEKKNG